MDFPPNTADPAAALHTTVHNYLSTLLSAAECLGSACPPVGGPYQHRLSRLAKRLAYDSSKEAVEESCAEVAKELKDYSAQAADYLRSHGVELRRAVAAVEEIVLAMAQRQDFYAAGLRRLVLEIESAPNRAVHPDAPDPGDSLQLAEAVPPRVPARAENLKTCIDSMFRESRVMVARMREELASVERRLADIEITDPVTGLTNRREMERRIHAASDEGRTPVLIRFDLGDPVPDDVARQVGARIGSQFRYNDVVCRWSAREFLVLFQGSLEVAQARSGQVAPWVAGRYLLDSGEIANIQVEASLMALDGLFAPRRETVSSEA